MREDILLKLTNIISFFDFCLFQLVAMVLGKVTSFMVNLRFFSGLRSFMQLVDTNFHMSFV